MATQRSAAVVVAPYTKSRAGSQHASHLLIEHRIDRRRLIEPKLPDCVPTSIIAPRRTTASSTQPHTMKNRERREGDTVVSAPISPTRSPAIPTEGTHSSNHTAASRQKHTQSHAAIVSTTSGSPFISPSSAWISKPHRPSRNLPTRRRQPLCAERYGSVCCVSGSHGE